jgi:hypothetical protein
MFGAEMDSQVKRRERQSLIVGDLPDDVVDTIEG